MSFCDDCLEQETPASDPLDGFAAFADTVRARLEQGRETYGDKSFSKDPAELVAELQAECLDLAGWGFVLFERLQAAQAALRDSATLRAQLSAAGDRARAWGTERQRYEAKIRALEAALRRIEAGPCTPPDAD